MGHGGKSHSLIECPGRCAYRAPMHIHRSNRVEELLAGLSRVVARPQADPLTPECIVVQGRGMERWLSLELADRLGVFAHPEFPFPRAFLQRTLDRVLGDEAGAPGGALGGMVQLCVQYST